MSYEGWALDLTWDEIPRAVRAQSMRCLKDVLGVAAGSRILSGTAELTSFVGSQFRSGQRRLWFSGRKSSLVGAAYHNAMLVDFLDAHDGFRPAKGHAGATVIPVALACAKGRTCGSELLAAIVVGYEVACRAGLAVHELYGPAYHASGSWAALGATVAGARLLGVPQSRLDAVVGAAEYYAPMSPMLRCIANPTPLKDSAGGGALAASMALGMSKQQMYGPPSLLVSETAGRQEAATLGESWLMKRQYFKPYPTCRWTHPAVEGVWSLQREHGFSHSDIVEIQVETFQAAARAMRFPPRDTHEAQYSLPWAVAAALVDGQLSVEQVSEARLADSEVVHLGRRVSARVAQDLEKRFPGECLARVTVTVDGGVRLTAPTTAARGDPDDPLSAEELDAKFECYVKAGLGVERARALGEVLVEMESLSARDLLEQLC